MNKIIFLPPARNFLKKLKDKNLKKLFEDAIKNISENPQSGQVKTGDLSGIYAYGFNYNKISYRIAYKVEINDDGTLTIIIMAGVHENFYKKLKEYLN